LLLISLNIPEGLRITKKSISLIGLSTGIRKECFQDTSKELHDFI